MILPWRVDVPEERWPVVNWLIIVAAVVVFFMQVAETIRIEKTHPEPQPSNGYRAPRDNTHAPPGPNAIAAAPADDESVPAFSTFILRGWSLKGLLGYMWLHSGLMHLLGNMWFLWVFGNAVCAKLGNFRYLGLYILMGIAAGIAHLLTSSAGALGASGAINGVVGMYLVLFPENDIICYWSPIIIYWRQFTVSSMWMVLFWLFWDVIGALLPGSTVAHTAHLGGFAAGFGIALLMLHKGWITMERYEKSLPRLWHERKERKAQQRRWARNEPTPALNTAVAEPQPVPAAPVRPVPHLDLNTGSVVVPDPHVIGATCSCGHEIRASRQYGGKIVRCPACRGVVMMPESIASANQPNLAALAGDDGFIRFACPCGKRVKMPARYAGRRGKCPGCGASIRIPPPA